MIVLSKKDINNIAYHYLEGVSENIEPIAGKGKNKKLIVKRGLILVHTDSGIEYTVLGIGISNEGEPIIVCSGPYGDIDITSDLFKDYERR